MPRPRAKPARAISPLVHQFAEIAVQKHGFLTPAAVDAGFASKTFVDWYKGANASIYNFEAALNFFGYKLKIVRIEDDHSND